MTFVLEFIAKYSELVVAILALAVALLLIVVVWLSFRLKRLVAGKNGKSLEATIVGLSKRVNLLEDNKVKTDGKIGNLDSRIARSIRGVETIKFNPFKGTGDGGNQSFSTAFITERGDGVVLSSMYSRDRVSVFAKPVRNLYSELTLSDEEKEALERADKSIQNLE